jgi:hypothetical protein
MTKVAKVLAIVDGPVEPRVVTAVAGAVAGAMGAEVEIRRPREGKPRDDLVAAIGHPEVVAAVLGFPPPRQALERCATPVLLVPLVRRPAPV